MRQKNYNRVHQSISSSGTGKPVLMMDVKVSRYKLADALIERTLSMLDKIESKPVHKDEGDQ